MAEGNIVATRAPSLSLRFGRNVANRTAKSAGRGHPVWRSILGGCLGQSRGFRRENGHMYSESRNTEQGLTEVEASQSEGSGRSGRRLGRGLEDVSDAFLSYPVVEAVQPVVSEPHALMLGQPSALAGET